MAFTKTGDSTLIKIMNVEDGKVISSEKTCIKCGKVICDCTKKDLEDTIIKDTPDKGDNKE